MMVDKKKDDSELNIWRYRYPSAGVSWRLSGDPMYCQRFVGEAKIMLYRVKNRMNIAFPKLKTLEDSHRFDDGTVVIVKSSFGQDFITIDASRGMAKVQCTITFINLPLSVPPMKDPGIAMGLPGVDYFKTYYSVNVKNCPACQEIAWELTFNPVYSISQSCWAEIVTNGRDEGGTFIIWKAYTEAKSTDVFSRSGLGILLLRGLILDSAGKTICSQESKIDVDCCWKDGKDRELTILAEKSTIDKWKTDLSISLDNYPICESYWDWCEVPSALPGDSLQEKTLFRARPDDKKYDDGQTPPPGNGSCLPYEWGLNGEGSLVPDGEFNEQATYTPPDSPGCGEIIITLQDRCGTFKQTHRACCDIAEELSIGYTSLVMGCSEEQTLDAVGGCAPFTWIIQSGGGTLVPSDDTKSAIYTSPETNPNCVDNPTIVLTDCCGNESTVKLAINCADGVAYWQTIYTAAGGFLGLTHCAHRVNHYSCDGSLINYCSVGDVLTPCPGTCEEIKAPLCEMYGCITDDGCAKYGTGSGCYAPNQWTCLMCNYWSHALYGAISGCTSDADMWKTCPDCSDGDKIDDYGNVCDKRTEALKLAGCCPINPLTGLPF
jgi:hypothetical protein